VVAVVTVGMVELVVMVAALVVALGTGHYLPVTRCLAVVDEDLGLLADGVGVAVDLGQRAAPHQQASCETQAGGQSCPAVH
jgi:hypothetical protein